ncbi:MAG: hypothetical protein HY961_19155 [Ignavibacteriae bacterium]|nr:hypothetical protein [Ignavibacteriota bacterium]
MNRLKILAVILLLIPFAGVPVAQAQQQGIPKDTEKKSKKQMTFDESKLGKPMFVETANGIKAQIWLISRADHDRLMEPSASMQPEPEVPDKTAEPTKGAAQNPMKKEDKYSTKKWEQGSMSGSSKYEVAILVLTDTKANMPLENATAEINWTAPSGKSAKSSLAKMSGHYSSTIDFSERGAYKLDLKVTHAGKTTTFKFDKPVNAS